MRIYVSHRPDADPALVRALVDRLRMLFQGNEILTSAPDLSKPDLEAAVSGSDVFVVLIDESWSVQPLDDEGSHARVEVEAAFGAGIPVIPVLVGDAALPARSALPPTMRFVSDQASVRVGADAASLDVGAIIEPIVTALAAADTAAPASFEAPGDATHAAVVAPDDDEAVQFSVFKPRELPLSRWTRLLAFMHLAEAGPDEPDPLAQVQAEVERRLGAEAAAVTQMTQDAAVEIPRESEITFAPEVEGVRFNPRERRFDWVEGVTFRAEEFELRPDGAPGARRGALRIYMGLVLIATIPLRLDVTESQAEPMSAPERVTAKPFQKVFVSYSHDDTDVAEHMERVASAFRLDYMRDVNALRAGDFWEPRILALIEDADVFQLLWSTHASRSAYVREEYLHAVGLGRPERFLVPLYWERPCPAPPRELSHIHFAPLPVGPGVDPTVDSELATDEDLLSTRGGSDPAIGDPAMLSEQFEAGTASNPLPSVQAPAPPARRTDEPHAASGGGLGAKIGWALVLALIVFAAWWFFV